MGLGTLDVLVGGTLGSLILLGGALPGFELVR